MIWSERANACTPHAVNSKGGGRSSGISRRMSANRFLATAPCAIWNVIFVRMANDVHANIDQPFPERRHRRILDRLRRRQRAQEVAEFPGEGMGLKATGDGG